MVYCLLKKCFHDGQSYVKNKKKKKQIIVANFILLQDIRLYAAQVRLPCHMFIVFNKTVPQNCQFFNGFRYIFSSEYLICIFRFLCLPDVPPPTTAFACTHVSLLFAFFSRRNSYVYSFVILSTSRYF